MKSHQSRKLLKLQVSAGLANRLRSIDSAVLLSRILNRKLEIEWPINEHLGADFNSLFVTPADFSVFSKTAGFRVLRELLGSIPFFRREKCFLEIGHASLSRFPLSDDPRQFFLHQVPLEKVSSSCDDVMIRTDHAFCYPEDFLWLQPIASIQEQVERIACRFNDCAIGLHIRRGDHRLAAERSPLSTFLREVERVIDENPLATFYLATDDVGVRSQLFARFGDRVVTSGATICRNTVTGVQAAVVDLVCLARCREIWGSFGSSFAETAFHLGGGEFYLIDGGNRVFVRGDRKKKGYNMTVL